MILVLLGITSLSADDFIPTKAFVTCLSFHAAERIKSCSLCSHLVRNNTKTWSQRLQLSPILSEERVTVCKMQREISDWNKIFFKNYMVKKKQSESSADVRLQWQELLPYSGGDQRGWLQANWKTQKLYNFSYSPVNNSPKLLKIILSMNVI